MTWFAWTAYSAGDVPIGSGYRQGRNGTEVADEVETEYRLAFRDGHDGGVRVSAELVCAGAVR